MYIYINTYIYILGFEVKPTGKSFCFVRRAVNELIRENNRLSCVARVRRAQVLSGHPVVETVSGVVPGYFWQFCV